MKKGEGSQEEKDQEGQRGFARVGAIEQE